MIEIEKKFPCSDSTEAHLVQKGAEFIKTVTHTDTYFDTSEFDLTTKEIWLRKRNGRFEMKIPLHELGGKGTVVERYKELETDDEIRSFLQLGEGDFETIVREAFVPFATIMTTRKKYRLSEYNIDIDETDFGYRVLEIELMLEDDGDHEQVAKQLVDFARSIGLDIEFVRGKVLTYISEHNPSHYQALEEAGVIHHL